MTEPTAAPIPPTPPKLYTPNPRDHYTVATKLWAGIVGAALALEAFGINYDRKHPGNRGKWTLTSNARPVFGFDSVTGLPLNVPHGTLRRSALVMFLAWLTWHWTSKRGTF